MKRFLSNHSASNVRPLTSEVVQKYVGKVPESLVQLWQTSGIGKYNNGLVELINPEEWNDTLWTWLGREVENYVPIALSAFGELFYYRKLTPDDEDVCLLDPHYRQITTCIWSLEGFFNDYLIESEVIQEISKNNLFQEAFQAKGSLKNGEIYYFVPALALGGSESLECIDKGDAKVHLDLLFQLG